MLVENKTRFCHADSTDSRTIYNRLMLSTQCRNNETEIDTFWKLCEIFMLKLTFIANLISNSLF